MALLFEKDCEIHFDKNHEIEKFWPEGMKHRNQEEAIEASIDRAALDFTARTETKKEDAGEETLSARLKRPSEKNLPKRLADYFQNPPKTQDAFNSWHHTVCEWILAVENEMYDNVCYGKAQKILNMTFKNLYCTAFGQKKEKENEHFFRFCHIALDSFTLEWIFRNIYPHYKELKTERLCKAKTPAWSKFTYNERKDDNGKEIYSYQFIADLIAEYFNIGHLSTTPFQAEFVIWKEIQLEMAAEAFYAQAYSYINEPDQQEKKSAFKMRPLKDKLKEIKRLMEGNELQKE